MKERYTAISRRQLLKLATGFGVSVGLHPLLQRSARATGVASPMLGELLPIDRYPNQIDLKVFQEQIKIGDRQSNAITVNGTVPGPVIRLKEGQIAKINVSNELDSETSIHWHGLILPATMDGVPGISFNGIKPKTTFSYEFPVNQNGTYWYHSHSGLQEQQGHFGALIIDSLQPEPFSYNRDYVVMLSDWTEEDPHQVLSNLKKVSTFYNYQQRTIAHFSEDADWARMRMDPTDIADVTGATYTYLMNGMAPANNWTALFKQGEKVRLRFINASAMTYFDVRIPGLKMTVVQADGQNVQPVSVDEFRIAVAETYDVIVEPEESKPYSIFAETMDRSGYARGTLSPQMGLVAAIPPLRTRPLRTMADMGMDHGSHGDHGGHGPKQQDKPIDHKSPQMDHGGHGMQAMPNANHAEHNMSEMNSSPAMDHSGHDMHNMDTAPAMDHSGHDMRQMDDGGADLGEAVPHGPDHHGVGNAGVPMMVKNRLHEPGIGLESTPDHKVLVYTDLRSLEPGSDGRSPDRELELHLTGNMERYMWSFDGKKYSESPILQFYYGERLRLTFVNDTMMEHPIHLHGMWMEIDNGAGAYKPRKHVLNVKPAEKCSVEVNVDVTGNWAFHCHLLYHMEAGMMRTVAIVERPMGEQS
ncbi:copper-resistance protein, CopA family (plasmid) [[Synechococcus] sp. NIES-970]|nr:copper-resistance protein, CopA family [[Synechococcus] sp. NIES-970]